MISVVQPCSTTGRPALAREKRTQRHVLRQTQEARVCQPTQAVAGRSWAASFLDLDRAPPC